MMRPHLGVNRAQRGESEVAGFCHVLAVRPEQVTSLHSHGFLIDPAVGSQVHQKTILCGTSGGSLL